MYRYPLFSSAIRVCISSREEDLNYEVNLLDGEVDGWMDGWVNEWKDGRMDGWVDVWMDGWMDVWMDGWMDDE